MHDGWQDVVIARICRHLFDSTKNVDEVFRTIDADNNGKVSYQEFIDAVKRLDVGLTDGQVRAPRWLAWACSQATAGPRRRLAKRLPHLHRAASAVLVRCARSLSLCVRWTAIRTGTST